MIHDEEFVKTSEKLETFHIVLWFLLGSILGLNPVRGNSSCGYSFKGLVQVFPPGGEHGRYSCKLSETSERINVKNVVKQCFTEGEVYDKLLQNLETIDITLS